MTDKQIIIDGVDVSGCDYYDKNKPLLTCVCEEYPCSECHNCYYKQKEKYKNALKEIKGIVEEVYNDEETQYQASGVCYEILQKIKECEM